MWHNVFIGILLATDVIDILYVDCDMLNCVAVEGRGSTNFDVVDWLSTSVRPCVTRRRGELCWKSATASLGPSSAIRRRRPDSDRMSAAEPDHLPRSRLLVTVRPRTHCTYVSYLSVRPFSTVAVQLLSAAWIYTPHYVVDSSAVFSIYTAAAAAAVLTTTMKTTMSCFCWW